MSVFEEQIKTMLSEVKGSRDSERKGEVYSATMRLAAEPTRVRFPAMVDAHATIIHPSRGSESWTMSGSSSMMTGTLLKMLDAARMLYRRINTSHSSTIALPADPTKINVGSEVPSKKESRKRIEEEWPTQKHVEQLPGPASAKKRANLLDTRRNFRNIY